MVKYREILRLRAMGVSQANTAHSCGCAQSTVQEVEKHAKAAGLMWPLPEEMDDAAIRARLYPRVKSRSAKFPIDHEKVDAEQLADAAISRCVKPPENVRRTISL